MIIVIILVIIFWLETDLAYNKEIIFLYCDLSRLMHGVVGQMRILMAVARDTDPYP